MIILPSRRRFGIIVKHHIPCYITKRQDATISCVKKRQTGKRAYAEDEFLEGEMARTFALSCSAIKLDVPIVSAPAALGP